MVTNAYASTVYVDSIDALSAPFSITSTTCGGAMASAATCTVSIEFEPTVTGIALQSLIINYGPTLAHDTTTLRRHQ